MPKRSAKSRPKRTPPAPPAAGFTEAQIAAAETARDRAAAGNPVIARHAFLGNEPVKLGALKIMPLTIGTFWMLEEINSPLAATGAEGVAPPPVTFRDVAAVAFILTDLAAAREALDRGAEAFRSATFALASQVPLEDMGRLTDLILGNVTAAFAPTPDFSGGGGANPTAPPASPRGSAGA